MAELLSSFVSEVSDWNYGPFARQYNSTTTTSSSAQFLNSTTLPFSQMTTSLTPTQVNVPVAVAVAVAIAVAVGVAVPVANAAIQAANNGPNSQNQQLNQQQISNVVSNAFVALSITAPVSISVPFVVAGLSFRTDECSDGGIRFNDGTCFPVLRRGPCPALQWILANPQSLTVTIKDRNFGTKFSGTQEFCWNKFNFSSRVTYYLNTKFRVGSGMSFFTTRSVR